MLGMCRPPAGLLLKPSREGAPTVTISPVRAHLTAACGERRKRGAVGQALGAGVHVRMRAQLLQLLVILFLFRVHLVVGQHVNM